MFNHLLEFAMLAVLVIVLIQNWLSAPGLLRFMSSGALALLGIAVLVVLFLVQVNQMPADRQGSFAGRIGAAAQVFLDDPQSSSSYPSSSSKQEP